MNFSNYKCPVCENVFTEEDDVVVCPDCGTPHHRECFIKNNKCFNEDKHGAIIEKLLAEEKTELKNSEETLENERDFEDIKNSDFESAKEEINNIFKQVEDNSWDKNTINGEPFANYAAAIGKNEKYYILRFKMMEKQNAKGVWNGVAFLVPFAWALYRKMYKIAAIVLALYMLFFGVLSYCLFGSGELMDATIACAEEDPDFSLKILEYANGEEGVTLTPAQTELMEMIKKTEIPVWVEVLNYVIIFGTRMFMGMRATPLYMKKIQISIRKAREKGLTEEHLRMYLSRKNGTLPIILAGIAGFFEIQIFLM